MPGKLGMVGRVGMRGNVRVTRFGLGWTLVFIEICLVIACLMDTLRVKSPGVVEVLNVEGSANDFLSVVVTCWRYSSRARETKTG